MKIWKLIAGIISILVGAEILREGNLLYALVTAFDGDATTVCMGILAGVCTIVGGILSIVNYSKGNKGTLIASLVVYSVGAVLCLFAPAKWGNLILFLGWMLVCIIVAGVDLYRQHKVPVSAACSAANAPTYASELVTNLKFCTKCGAPTQPGMKFCEQCGAPLVSGGMVAASSNETVQAVPSVEYVPQREINWKKVVTIVLSVLLVAGLGTGGYFWYKDYSEKKEREEARQKAEQEELEEQQRQAELDAASWERATVDNSAEAYREYIAEFPEGKHVADAKAKLAHIEKLRLTGDEEYSVQSAISSFVYGLAAGDEEGMLSPLAPTMNKFMNKTNATKVDAISYLHRLHADDVMSISASYASSDVQVEKSLDESDNPVYTANFSYDLRYDREDTSLETFASMSGHAVLNDHFKITTLTLKKLSSY